MRGEDGLRLDVQTRGGRSYRPQDVLANGAVRAKEAQVKRDSTEGKLSSRATQ